MVCDANLRINLRIRVLLHKPYIATSDLHKLHIIMIKALHGDFDQKVAS